MADAVKVWLPIILSLVAIAISTITLFAHMRLRNTAITLHDLGQYRQITPDEAWRNNIPLTQNNAR